MLSEFFLKIPYLLFFIPLMASALMNFIYDKRFMVSVTNLINIVMLVLTLKMVANCGDFGVSHFITTTTKFNVLSTEFKISTVELLFFICILLCNFLGFINYINEILFSEKLNNSRIKYFFSIYLIYVFSIVGIIFTYNIFNLFLFLEIYSFCIYVMISIYNKENLNIISYKFFTSNVFGSILLAITMFYITIYFGTSNMMEIKQQIMTLNLKENYEVLLMFVLFLSSIIVKFFLTNTSRYHNTKNVGINFLSISNIFVNVLIGIYLMYEVLFFLFDSRIIFSTDLLKYIILSISTLVIIYNSVVLVFTKENTLFNIFLRLNLINLGYIMLSVLPYQNDRQLSTNLFMLYVFEFSLVNLFIYLFSGIISLIYKHNSLTYLNQNKTFKIVVLIILFYKMFLPFGTSLYMNMSFVSHCIENKGSTIYLIPFFVSKICYLTLFMTILNNKKQPALENAIIINKKHLNTLYFSVFLLFVLVVFFEIFFSRGMDLNIFIK